MTGRHWRRPARACPGWCAGGHQCTAQHGYASGEHRSPPTTWLTPYGYLIATRVARPGDPERVELRLSVRLDADPRTALAAGAHLPIVVDLAVRTLLGDLRGDSRGGPSHRMLLTGRDPS